MKNNKQKTVFAIIWALIFFLSAAYPALSNKPISSELIAISIFFVLLPVLSPALLNILFSHWLRIGTFMGSITSILILIIIFYLLITPVSIILKLIKRDVLCKKMNNKNITYWSQRENQPGTFRNQY